MRFVSFHVSACYCLLFIGILISLALEERKLYLRCETFRIILLEQHFIEDERAKLKIR